MLVKEWLKSLGKVIWEDIKGFVTEILPIIFIFGLLVYLFIINPFLAIIAFIILYFSLKWIKLANEKFKDEMRNKCYIELREAYETWARPANDIVDKYFIEDFELGVIDKRRYLELKESYEKHVDEILNKYKTTRHNVHVYSIRTLPCLSTDELRKGFSF